MIFGRNTTHDISKLSPISLAFTYTNFEISLVVFMPNITTTHAITYTNRTSQQLGETITTICNATQIREPWERG